MRQRFTVRYEFRNGNIVVDQYLVNGIDDLSKEIFNYLISTNNDLISAAEKDLITTELFQYKSNLLMVPLEDLINVWDFSAITSASIHIVKTSVSLP